MAGFKRLFTGRYVVFDALQHSADPAISLCGIAPFVGAPEAQRFTCDQADLSPAKDRSEKSETHRRRSSQKVLASRKTGSVFQRFERGSPVPT